MKKLSLSNLALLAPLAGLFLLVALSSCSENDGEWNPYYDWQGRNTQWFAQAADSARTAIAKAKAQYGDAWEAHCQWRMFKSLQRSTFIQGPVTDSIVCKVVSSGATTGIQPDTINYSDTVRLHYRGWLMPTEYLTTDNTRKELKMTVFSQTYYGTFNPATAAPVTMPVSSTVEGFQTALQHMAAGDTWYVYIPQQLAYGSQTSEAVPAYSTLLFLLNIVGKYETGQGVPDWK